jgi:glucokinase
MRNNQVPWSPGASLSLADHVHEAATSTVLAFDIGGSRIKAGLVRGTSITSLNTVPTISHDGADLLDTIIRLGRQLMADQDVAGVGLSVKGVVDPERGVLADVNEALTSWINRPFAEVVAAELALPVSMENDARMYALGELVYEAGRDCQNLVCLTLGTGLGTGVVLGRRLLRGPRGTAGVLGGHFTVRIDGATCSCGNIGCLEILVGAAGLVHSAETALAGPQPSSLRSGPLDPPRIFAAAAAGDAVAQDVVSRFTSYLAAGVVTMIHAYDPDTVVVGGGIGHAAAQFLPAVQAYVDIHTWAILRGRVQVVPAMLGDAAALIGIAALARSADLLM